MRERAILVDWELYQRSPATRAFVQDRKGQARMILLVNDPARADYVHPADNGPAFEAPEVEWDVVIRNTGAKGEVEFARNAMNIIRDVSELDVVIYLTTDRSLQDEARSRGVLLAMSIEE